MQSASLMIRMVIRILAYSSDLQKKQAVKHFSRNPQKKSQQSVMELLEIYEISTRWLMFP